MIDDVDPGLVALFGSENRALTLGVLANAFQPLTGYRVAWLADLQRTKTNVELQRLADGGVVRKDTSPDGQIVWSLIDPNLRALLRKKIRITWDQDWDAERKGWAEETPALLAKAAASLGTTSLYNPKNRIPAKAIKELERSPAKNRILRSLGARPSVRKE